MVTLSLKDSGAVLGTIDDADLQVLIDQLEEEHDRDTDYYISPATIDVLERNGASAGLVKLLRAAVGESEGVDIEWKPA